MMFTHTQSHAHTHTHIMAVSCMVYGGMARFGFVGVVLFVSTLSVFEENSLDNNFSENSSS
jgi:hypothetical protein